MNYKIISRFSVLLIFVACINTSLYAQGTVTTPLPTPAPTDAQSQATHNDEVVALRAQLELMKQYDQRLLATVYWALGATGGIVLLVVGLGWYTNFRIYRRDVEDMKRDMRAHVDNLITSLRSDMLKEARQAGNSALSSTLYDFRKMQYQLLEVEAEKWKRGDVFENALSVNSEMLELAVDNQNEYWVRDVIDSMLKILKNQKLPLLDTSTTVGVMKVLDKLPKEYSTEVDSIKELLRAKRTH